MKNEVHECIPGRSEERGGREREGKGSGSSVALDSLESASAETQERERDDDESERDGKHRLESPLAFPFHLLP